MTELDVSAMRPPVREAARLALSIIAAANAGVEEAEVADVLVDGFDSDGHVLVNGMTIRTVDALNAAVHLASHLYRQHAGSDPEQALQGDLLTLTRWEADHE